MRPPLLFRRCFPPETGRCSFTADMVRPVLFEVVEDLKMDLIALVGVFVLSSTLAMASDMKYRKNTWK